MRNSAEACGREASAKCQYKKGPYCVHCCDCPRHGHRYTKSEQHLQHPSKRKRGVPDLDQQIDWTVNAMASWIEQHCPETWPKQHRRSMRSQRRYLLRVCDFLVHGMVPDFQSPPEQWMEMPSNLRKQLFALLSFRQNATPDDPALIERCDQKAKTGDDNQAQSSAPPSVDWMETRAENDDDEPSALLSTSSVWPQRSTGASSSAIAAATSSSAAAWLSMPLSPVSTPALPHAWSAWKAGSLKCVFPHNIDYRDSASREHVDNGLCKGITTTSNPRMLSWPWCEEVRQEFRPVAQGYWPWDNVRKCIAPFRNRVQGPYPAVMDLQRGNWHSMEDFLAAGGILSLVPPVHVDDELPVLCEWLAARKMADRIESVQVVSPCPTADLPPGSWVCATLSGPSTMMTSKGPYNKVGYRSTSMNNLNRNIVHGLHEDWTNVRSSLQPACDCIHVMAGLTKYLCGHALYTPLHRTGYYYAPYLEVRYAYDAETDSRRHVAVKAGPATQYLTYPDVSFVSAIYFHVVAAADMLYGTKAHWLNIEVDRPAKMEIPVDVAPEVLVERSRMRYLELKAAERAPDVVND